MFAEDIRRAVTAAPPTALPEISAALWKAFAAGEIAEAEADDLSRLIGARRTVPAPAPRRRPGARPRTPESLARRRRWAASGWLPPRLADAFTQAEVAALAVVAWRCAVSGRCAMPIGLVAALAGVGRTKVKDALRKARETGLLRVEERRRRGARSDTNLVSVASDDWRAWLSRTRATGVGGGVAEAAATDTGSITPSGGPGRNGRKGLPGRCVGQVARVPRNGWGGQGRRPGTVPRQAAC